MPLIKVEGLGNFRSSFLDLVLQYKVWKEKSLPYLIP